MAAQTPMYIYNQRQTVVLLEPGASIATRRYETVYAKELTVSKGVDNLLEFAMINQDQKPVNISGKQITARIISYNGTETLLQKTLIPVLPVTGITSLQLTESDLENIDAQRAYYTLEIPGGNMYVSSVIITNPGSGYDVPPTVSIVGGGGSGATATAEIANGEVVAINLTNGGTGYTGGARVVISESPTGSIATATVNMTGSEYGVFVDSLGSTRGVINIVNGVMPSFTPSQQVTVPSHPWPPGANGNGVIYSTSTINTRDSASFTLQTTYANFTGETSIVGSIMADFSLPYQITEPVTYMGYSSTISNVAVVSGNTWITQGLSDSGNVFVGANVFLPSSNSNAIVTALGTGNGNIQLNNSSGLTVGDEIVFTTHGYSGTIGIDVSGYHPYIRMAVLNKGTEGEIPTWANVANLSGTYYGGDITNVLFR